jgi:protein gp37
MMDGVNLMNRTSIEWTDLTWNPIVGCDHGCWYCYAKRLTRRFPKNFPNGFKPTFHPGRLKEPWALTTPKKIFCCSISDLFAPWSLQSWRDHILFSIFECPVKHTFQLLTKNPERIEKYVNFPKNLWIGTTVTCENQDWRNLEQIKKVKCGVRFASFEPLLGMLPEEISLKGLDWIIIGKLTGSSRVKLDPKWVQRICVEANDLEIPIFLKNNLLKSFSFPKIQNFPGEMKDE